MAEVAKEEEKQIKNAPSNDDAKQDEKDEQKDKPKQEYFDITAERRTRFQTILEKMDEFKFKLNKTAILEFVIDKDTKFRIETRVTFAKCFKHEPTVWYLTTIMPGKPETFLKFWGDSEYRLKWDSQISSHNKMELWHEKDNSTALRVVNYQTVPMVGGLVSPRQFTTLVQRWKLANEGLELAAQSTKYKDFPSKKGFVDAWNTLYGQRITVIDAKELKDEYGVPELEVMSGDKKEALTWCKCRYVIQTDIKGWLPNKVVQAAVGGGSIGTFDGCREYMLKEVFGFKKLTVKTIQ